MSALSKCKFYENYVQCVSLGPILTKIHRHQDINVNMVEISQDRTWQFTSKRTHMDALSCACTSQELLCIKK